MPSHQDFILPGIRADPTNARLKALIVLATFAYSRQWNRRRLESHWYGLWNQILSDLIFDLAPNLFLVPQHTIYLTEQEPNDPDLSFGTVAEGAASERIPDFVALAAVPRLRNVGSATDHIFPSSYDSWKTMKLLACFPAMIVQLKRSPPRSLLQDGDFRDILQSYISAATTEADDSAALAFHNKQNRALKKIVLVAVSGEWWRFKIGLRENYEVQMNLDSKLSMENEEDDKDETKKARASKKGKGKYIPKLYTIQRHEDLGPRHMAQLSSDVKKTEPRPGTWSKNILFGTPASNQRLYFIHELLKEIQHGLIGEVDEHADNFQSPVVSSEDELASYEITS
ncbi:hypothetical protein AGABI2DRAFT_147038 [Agaricus bisporus var. bisporus H97]|uniref:hypothetical protein n=1 Tax=Agaricus bisporus var. bisporus (strain H97 / ATCC MYA-4626 / FGSC 10389) TaxID=936046 RepID=UPI00029F703A|nr:hypothetical protein AGABI2DRAFT_147038 [Agaricus bisporus var. bisporus H97]EKV41903.1 hypothetical protein AGABI2DRAFT_147038 [Agaricus bisporus var. bisporus H97]